MLRCDPRVFARCPYNRSCISLEEAVFAEGSDCDLFNRRILESPVTNGDRFRSLNDAQLCKVLYSFENLESVIPFCQPDETCRKLLNTPGGVPENRCRKCLLLWLKAPAAETGKEMKQDVYPE